MIENVIETDVLIIGSGPSGLTAAVGLAQQGIRTLVITKHRRLSPTPRAHVTNQRTFEVLRDFGLEERARALATPYKQMPDELFMRSLVGEEFGRVRGMGTEGGNHDVSPCSMADLPQHLLEPLLFDAATLMGAHVRFDTELVSFTQDADGVTAEMSNRLSGKRDTVRARFLIGADGGRSLVAQTLNLPFEGPGEIGGSANIHFTCDLTPYVAHRPGMLYFLVRTPEDKDGAGLGILRCIKPWSSWLLIKGYSSGQGTPELSESDAADVVCDYLGIRDLSLKVTGIDRWPMNALYARRYHGGRVFCMGDAVHRHVPSNGLGSNTGIQDAYNLAWKLALVVRGKAMPRLLDSYSDERAPIGQQVVERATKSLQSYAPILDALGVIGTGPSEGARNLSEIGLATPTGAQRREALRIAVRRKIYEFQARGVEFNQFYRSSAVINDRPELDSNGNDLELYHHSTTSPGAKLPHAWVQRDGRSLSTLDLVGGGRFTVLTGTGGECWIAAAKVVSKQFGLDIASFSIGAGCRITDLYYEWNSRREIEDDGCLLIRPDGYIAWRCRVAQRDKAEEVLASALSSILGYKTAPSLQGHVLPTEENA
ncbi:MULTISPECIES: FAD-dependent oxidoreductase [unclassified Phyllobacterium]|uniref:FAD-dependent oxidoreductase n=1 Tax=unclassified Phyllobacterium TaxID=2638441 RepID=UPI003012DC0E